LATVARILSSLSQEADAENPRCGLYLLLLAQALENFPANHRIKMAFRFHDA
jgi:hypothetical protein